MTKRQQICDEFLLIVDATGSMRAYGKHEEAIAGVNSFLETQAEFGEANVTVVLFDKTNGIRTIARRRSLDFRLDKKNYCLGGMTQLYETCIISIEGFEMPKKHGKVIVGIITDGNENASRREYTKARLQELIRDRSEKDWQFFFLGQGIEAAAEGEKVGVNRGTRAKTTSFERALNVTSEKVGEYRQTGNAERLVYSEDDRKTMA